MHGYFLAEPVEYLVKIPKISIDLFVTVVCHELNVKFGASNITAKIKK